jgi:hypothetical protein
VTLILFFGPNRRSSPSPATFCSDVCGEDADPLSNKLILTIAYGRLPVLTDALLKRRQVTAGFVR